MKKQKEKCTVANNLSEYVIHIALPTLQAIAVVLMAALVKAWNWTSVLILVILSAALLFFAFMLFYKLYRARLTLVTFTQKTITYTARFKKRVIAADDIMITLCDPQDAKQPAKKHYCMVCDKAAPDDGFFFAVGVKSSLDKLAYIAPPLMVRFIVACTSAEVLEKTRSGASDELAEYINVELEAREKRREQAEREQKRKNKNKRKR